MVKNPSANSGNVRDTGSIPGSGGYTGGGHGNPFKYSYLEKPTERSQAGNSPEGCKKSDMTEAT